MRLKVMKDEDKIIKMKNLVQFFFTSTTPDEIQKVLTKLLIHWHQSLSAINKFNQNKIC